MKLASKITALMIVALMVLVPGLAHGEEGPNPAKEGMLKGFEGQVLADGTAILGNVGSLRITLVGSQMEKEIHLTGRADQPDYQLGVPGHPQVKDAATALEPGAGVAVLAREVNGEWSAVQVLVKPEYPTIAPRVGVVVESNEAEGTVKLMTSSGHLRTLSIPSGVEAPPNGELVVAFTRSTFDINDLRTLEAPDSVQGLATSSDVTKRLERQLAEASSDQGNMAQSGQQSKELQVEKLANLIEDHASKQRERLETAFEKSRQRDKDVIKEAIDRSDIQEREVRAVVKDARDKASPPGQDRNQDSSDGSDSKSIDAGSTDDAARGNRDSRGTDNSGRSGRDDGSDKGGSSRSDNGNSGGSDKSGGSSSDKGSSSSSSDKGKGGSSSAKGNSSSSSDKGGGSSSSSSSDKGSNGNPDNGSSDSSSSGKGSGNSSSDKGKGGSSSDKDSGGGSSSDKGGSSSSLDKGKGDSSGSSDRGNGGKNNGR